MFRVLCFIAILSTFMIAEQNLDSNTASQQTNTDNNPQSSLSSDNPTKQSESSTTTTTTENTDLIKTLTQPEESEITAINGDKKNLRVTISNLSLVPGEIGFISRDLGSYEGIIASVEVEKVEGSSAICKVGEFKQLEQKFLPEPMLSPKEGDKVMFRQFNDKAFLIAPNEKTYRAIRDTYPYINFISSDLLMGFLNQRGKYDPSIKNLPAACSMYNAGLLFVVGSNEVAVFDCQSMIKITKYPMDVDRSDIKTPFYTRVNFEGGGSLTYSLSSKKSRNYFPFYDNFIQDPSTAAKKTPKLKKEKKKKSEASNSN